MSLTGIKNYSEADLREEDEAIDRFVGDTRVVGIVSPDFRHLRLYWESDIDGERFLEKFEEAEDDGLEGYRLDNDARVSYHAGRTEYSTTDGDLSELEDLAPLFGEEADVIQGFAEEIESDYRWIDS